MKTYALYNIKGGVGKTATAVNLAYLSAEAGFRTLLWDLDPQGSTTYYFRVKPSSKLNLAKLLKSTSHISKRIKATDFENLDLVPASLSLRNFDIELDHVKRSRKRLKAIQNDLHSEYDRIIMDCPPGIDLLSENVFRSADKVLVPIIPTTLSLRTFNQLNFFFKQENLKPSKIVPFYSMVDERKKLHQEVTGILSADSRFLKTRIPMSAEVEKMGISRRPLVNQSPKDKVSKLYRQLWDEIEEV